MASETWTAAHWTEAKVGDEVASLKSALYPYNARDALAGAQHVSETKNGVTFAWSGDTCTVSTASGGTTGKSVNIMLEPSPLPEDIVAGQLYRVMFSTTSEDVYLRFLFYDSEDATTAKYIVDTGADGVYMKIPVNAVKWTAGLYMDEGVILSTPAIISGVHLLTTMTNAELAEKVDEIDTESAKNVADIAVLDAALTKYNARDVLAGALTYVSETKNGVTFAWTGDVCTVSTTSGGASATTVNTLNGLTPTAIPDDIAPGNRYAIKYTTTDAGVVLRVRFFDANDTTLDTKYVTQNARILVPMGTRKWLFGLYIVSGTVLTTPATVSDIHLISARTNAELSEDIDTAIDTTMLASNELSMSMARTHESVLSGGDNNIKWLINRNINETTGQIENTAANYSVTDYIRVPAGATAVVTSFASSLRYATYDEDHNVIQVYTGAWGINIRISSEDAAFFAIRYNSTDIETLKSAVSVTFDYQNGIAREEAMRRAVKNETGYSNESGTASGNPILLTDARGDAFEALGALNLTDGEIVSLCGKNLFHFQHPAQSSLTSNGVTFFFDMLTQTMTITSTTGATGTAVSVNATFPASCLKLDGVDAYHNAHFRFAADTTVTITPNYSVNPFYDSKVEMRVMWIDGSTLRTLPIGYEGVTLVAKAGVQYGLRVRVSTGFVGSLTLRPQIEIGGSSTAYERYSGCEVPYPSVDGSANIFAMPQANQLMSQFGGGKITLKFDYLDGAFDIVSTGPASNVATYNSEYDGLVNGKNWLYIARVTPDAGPVCVSGIPDELAGLAKVQVSDGTTTYTAITSRPIMFVADGSTQYGYRVYVNAGAMFTHRIKPVIATGVEALRLFGAAHPVTSIYTDGSATLTVGYKKAALSEKINDAISVAGGVKTLTGGRIAAPFARLKKLGPMISFIDDDTTNAAYVQLFHDIFADEGVVGNYAVEMENLETNPGLDEILLGYEQEGHGMLYHCYKQHGDVDRYWESGNAMYDESLIRENFYKGLRMYKEVGFNSSRYWVTPYGVNDKFIQNLAKEADMECLLSCPTSTYACNAIIGYGSNVSRWNMPRFIFLSDTDNDWQGRMMIDGCAASGGWVVFVTHVNSWPAGSVTELTARLKGLIQYAKAAGLRVANFNEAYKTFEPLLRINELM